VVHEEPGGGVDGEGLDGVEDRGAGAEAVAAAVAFDLVPEFGEFLEVALQGAVADAELAGEVGGGAGAGGEERGEVRRRRALWDPRVGILAQGTAGGRAPWSWGDA
jgi:hypothetical protein